MYVIQPWHNVILLVVALLLHLPLLIDELVHPAFQVHPTGAVVITGTRGYAAVVFLDTGTRPSLGSIQFWLTLCVNSHYLTVAQPHVSCTKCDDNR